jgi:hypothetical protein
MRPLENRMHAQQDGDKQYHHHGHEGLRARFEDSHQRLTPLAAHHMDKECHAETADAQPCPEDIGEVVALKRQLALIE